MWLVASDMEQVLLCSIVKATLAQFYNIDECIRLAVAWPGELVLLC